MPAPGFASDAPPILYSCDHARSRQGEHFVPEHVLNYQIAGSMVATSGEQRYEFRAGDFHFFRRNRLLKFDKQPPAGGEFQSLSIFLDQAVLRDLSREYGYQATPRAGAGIVALPPDARYHHYLTSLQPYQQLHQAGNAPLLALKRREAVLLLLQTNPALQDVLFDFSEPGKIDLEAFMHQHFHFKVDLARFAYLTGRSLATFQRDFARIFRLTPNRWLQQRRLREAHYLIKEQGKRASEVYLELGFENLSHFSFAFKKAYGVAPSRVGSGS